MMARRHKLRYLRAQARRARPAVCQPHAPPPPLSVGDHVAYGLLFLVLATSIVVVAYAALAAR